MMKLQSFAKLFKKDLFLKELIVFWADFRVINIKIFTVPLRIFTLWELCRFRNIVIRKLGMLLLKR